jgi:hypothetical protein
MGDGNWDRLAYWQKNHPGNYAANGNNLPAGATDLRNLSGGPGITGPSRYQVYRYELENPDGVTPRHADGTIVPDVNFDGNLSNPTQEEEGHDIQGRIGCPNLFTTQCGDILGNLDRRVMIMTVLNCLEYSVNGNVNNVPVEDFAMVFMLQPYGQNPNPDPNTNEPEDGILVEIIGSIGQFSGLRQQVLHDVVQLYR